METHLPLILISFICFLLLGVLGWRERQRRFQQVTPGEPGAAAPPLQTQKSLPTCGNCTHFDLEEGQAVIAEYPAFVGATEALSPRRMGAQVNPETGERIVSDQIPARCKWKDFGACKHHGAIVWNEDTCPQFLPQKEGAA